MNEQLKLSLYLLVALVFTYTVKKHTITNVGKFHIRLWWSLTKRKTTRKWTTCPKGLQGTLLDTFLHQFFILLYTICGTDDKAMQLLFYSVTFNAHLQWTRTGLSNKLIWLRISSMTVKMLSISSGTEWSSHGMKCHWVSWRTKDMSSSRYHATHATHAHHAIIDTLCLKNIPPLCFLNNLSKSQPVFITCQYAMHVQCNTVSPILPVQCVNTWTQLHVLTVW